MFYEEFSHPAMFTLGFQFGSTPDLVFLAGVALLTMWAVARLRGTLHAHKRDRSVTARERIEEVRSTMEGRERVERTMVDLQELTRRLAAHLDNKAARIEKLLKEADQRIAQLQSFNAQAAPREGERPTAMVEVRPFDSTSRTGSDPLSREVCGLADTGLSSVQIAQELDEQIGKVELILALRSR